MMMGKEALQRQWRALFVQQENQEDELTSDGSVDGSVDGVTKDLQASMQL